MLNFSVILSRKNGFIRRLKAGGFTLIELLVVIAIIGILSSVVMASLNVARKKARDTKRIFDIKQLQLALELYFETNRTYPDVETNNALPPSLAPGYISTLPADPLDPPHSIYQYYATTNIGGVCSEVAKTCMKYHLGAMLEEATNIALFSDSDNAAGFNGDSTDCAGAAGTDTCFDVTD